MSEANENKNVQPRGRLWTCRLCGWSNPPLATECIACERKRPRPRKKAEKAEPLEVANACVVLGIDVANKSGWAIGDTGKIVDSGQHQLMSTRGARETLHVIERAIEYAHGAPLVTVFERPWGGRMARGSTTGEGYWLHALLFAGVPLRLATSVYPSQWRAVELPIGMGSAKREDARRAEQSRAGVLVGGAKVGEDEAPAICIAHWGMFSHEVARML